MRGYQPSAVAGFVSVLALGATLSLATAATASAQAAGSSKSAVQSAGRQTAPAPASGETVGASTLREKLTNVLEQYPPSIGRVLKLDPTLLTNQSYLASYPALATFLSQHPEIARSPDYYLASIRTEMYPSDYYTRSASQRMWEDVMAGAALVTVFVTAVALDYVAHSHAGGLPAMASVVARAGRSPQQAARSIHRDRRAHCVRAVAGRQPVPAIRADFARARCSGTGGAVRPHPLVDPKRAWSWRWAEPASSTQARVWIPKRPSLSSRWACSP